VEVPVNKRAQEMSAQSQRLPRWLVQRKTDRLEHERLRIPANETSQGPPGPVILTVEYPCFRRVQIGKIADLTLFDPDTVTDTSTFTAGENGLPSKG